MKSTGGTRRWDVYGWAVIVVLMTLYLLGDLVGLDSILGVLIVPAGIIFAVIVLPYLFRGRP